MKILITGTAGFIGFHLAETLSKLGVEIVGIDNINDYYDIQLKFDRLKESGVEYASKYESELIQSSIHPKYRFAKIDLTNYDALSVLFKKEKFTHVVNLAAQAGVRYSIENPHAYIQSNLVGFVNLLECCKNYSIKHLVYASSSSVYGNTDQIPFQETQRVDHPVSLYAASKKSNELMAHTYKHIHGLNSTGLRFFTVYGPWGRPDMAPMLFANAILNGKPIKVFNHGDLKRDFTFIDDIIDGVIKCINLTIEDEAFAKVFNIGNSEPVDLMEFITEIENSFGKKAIKNFLPMQDGDVNITYADTSELNQATGFVSKTPLRDGLRVFAKWYLDYH